MTVSIGQLLFIISSGIPFAHGYVKLYREADDELVTIKASDCEQQVVTFPIPTQFTCACVKGIYSFFANEKCSANNTWMTYGGDNSCFQLEHILKIGRVEFLNYENAPFLTILDPDSKFVRARYTEPTKFPHSRKGDILVVVGTWTLILKDGREICLTSYVGYYCIFRNVPKFIAFQAKCSNQAKKISPQGCKPVLKTKDIITSCPAHEEEQVAGDNLARKKRAIQGRTFLPASLAMKPRPSPPPSDEVAEDYNLNGANGSHVVKTEIWTYATEKALKALDPNRSNLSQEHFKTPAYEILQLCKMIMQKGCPDYYVKTSHWELAVSSFIRMQQRSFKFREIFVDLQELSRINSTLETCLNHTMESPFITPNETCVDGQSVLQFEPGQFFKFNEVIMMTVPIDMTSMHNEPLIETVWKIFLYVHSRCYQTFKTYGRLNDHNRFTTLLTPLFTNDAWDVWMKDDDGKPYELKKDVYAGLLGNALELMERVDYCAWFPRLEDNYPWELTRPSAKMPVPLRRRRSVVDEGLGVCNKIAADSEGKNC